MKLALFARKLSRIEKETLRAFIKKAIDCSCEIYAHQNISRNLKSEENKSFSSIFSDTEELQSLNPDILLCFGGDGTMLDTALLIRDQRIPVLGINTGRLGFLSQVIPDKVGTVIDIRREKKYEIDKRSLLELSNVDKLGKDNLALNDISIHKRDTSSMITVKTYLNGDFFNTYWADGLLISTPTGSTAYSLSCGGPILFPDTPGLVITPVAPHNLNVRPIVISDQTSITLKVEGRGSNYLVALDSRNVLADYATTLEIKRAPFELHTVRLPGKLFAETIREKLNWGKDNRNLD